MSKAGHHKLIEKIVYGLKIAEREMLEEKARNNEDVIVCGDDNVICHIPAQNFCRKNNRRQKKYWRSENREMDLVPMQDAR